MKCGRLGLCRSATAHPKFLCALSVKPSLMNTQEMASKKDIAIAFLQLAASGRAREGYDKHAAAGFRHHNAHFDASPDALINAMDANARQFPQKTLDVKLALEDGPLVAVFSHVRHTTDEPGFAVVHIFRFEDSHIVEMWDLAQQVPAASPNANGMF